MPGTREAGRGSAAAKITHVGHIAHLSGWRSLLRPRPASSSSRVIIRTALAVLAMTATLAAPAAAAEPHAQLTLKRTTNPQPGGGGIVSSTQLNCGPTGGPHKRAAEACALLDTVDGNYKDLRPAQDMLCNYGNIPVRIELAGRWGGRQVYYADTVSNECQMVRWTGAIFQF
ncbi:hypothetical protein D5S17_19410 [Pseudonocardiaceae bacterium YIM PH 21723]|nr:hypothetical protein D5S17_19410 [Pseudonocardiaceae bacterium YIM PH 21723]